MSSLATEASKAAEIFYKRVVESTLHRIFVIFLKQCLQEKYQVQVSARDGGARGDAAPEATLLLSASDIQVIEERVLLLGNQWLQQLKEDDEGAFYAELLEQVIQNKIQSNRGFLHLDHSSYDGNTKENTTRKSDRQCHSLVQRNTDNVTRDGDTSFSGSDQCNENDSTTIQTFRDPCNLLHALSSDHDGPVFGKPAPNMKYPYCQRTIVMATEAIKASKGNYMGFWYGLNKDTSESLIRSTLNRVQYFPKVYTRGDKYVAVPRQMVENDEFNGTNTKYVRSKILEETEEVQSISEVVHPELKRRKIQSELASQPKRSKGRPRLIPLRDVDCEIPRSPCNIGDVVVPWEVVKKEFKGSAEMKKVVNDMVHSESADLVKVRSIFQGGLKTLGTVHGWEQTSTSQEQVFKSSKNFRMERLGDKYDRRNQSEVYRKTKIRHALKGEKEFLEFDLGECILHVNDAGERERIMIFRSIEASVKDII